MTSDDIRYEQQDQANEKFILLLREILFKLEEGELQVNMESEILAKSRLVLDDDCETLGYHINMLLDVV